MKASVMWKDNMQFEGSTGNHAVIMDAKNPIGKDTGATPKELVAMGLGGCTAMDVIALLKKHKQLPESFEVELAIETTASGYPAVFEKAVLFFKANGKVDADKLIEAVRLSQTKYCGVSAMLAKAFPIEYRIILNDVEINKGFAQF